MSTTFFAVDSTNGWKEITVSGGGGGGSQEIAYGQVTTNMLITDTSESTGTALITAGPAAYSGAPVIAEFYCAYLQGPTTLGGTTTITLFEGTTEITRLILTACYVSGLHTASSAYGAFRFTPSAATHTYSICGFASTTAGTPQIIAGAGGTATYAPAYLRMRYA